LLAKDTRARRYIEAFKAAAPPVCRLNKNPYLVEDRINILGLGIYQDVSEIKNND
jgi:hypothetical protein